MAKSYLFEILLPADIVSPSHIAIRSLLLLKGLDRRNVPQHHADMHDDETKYTKCEGDVEYEGEEGEDQPIYFTL